MVVWHFQADQWCETDHHQTQSTVMGKSCMWWSACCHTRALVLDWNIYCCGKVMDSKKQPGSLLHLYRRRRQQWLITSALKLSCLSRRRILGEANVRCQRVIQLAMQLHLRRIKIGRRWQQYPQVQWQRKKTAVTSYIIIDLPHWNDRHRCQWEREIWSSQKDHHDQAQLGGGPRQRFCWGGCYRSSWWTVLSLLCMYDYV